MKKKIESNFGQELTEEENKMVQLKILKYVDNYCTKHKLRYFLGDGTLLGAVRHQGYIPWDDDIDIRMPRPDYNKMIKNFNTDVGNDCYKLINPKSSEANHYFVKIIDTRTIKVEPYMDYSQGFFGVDIDVFPLDGAPEDETEFLKWADKIRSYNKAFVYKKRQFFRSCLSRVKDITAGRVRARILPFMSCSEITEKVNELVNLYPFDKSKYVCGVGVIDRFRTKYSCFEEYILMPFENEKFRVPVGYDEVLTEEYGNYMQLPPEEERITHHTNKVYWKKGE